MTGRMLLWYKALTARERYLVLAAGVFAVLTLGYLLVVPLDDALASAKARHADAVIALGETQARVDAVKVVKAAQAAQAGRAARPDVPLESVIRARANDAGFALASVVPQGQDRVQIAIAAARPGALTGWLADLEAGGIIVDRLETTDNGDRSVAAHVTLKAQGS